MLKTPEEIRELQRKLYRKAKQEKEYRFYLLYDKVCRPDILSHAYRLVKANKGAPGIDGETFDSIEEREGGAEKYLEEIAGALKRKDYKPQAVRRVYIPKAAGGKRPLGIPVIRDRVVQMAVKIVIEPIFEADFQDNSYGFRPKRSAHQAVEDVRNHLLEGKTEVIDADISKYFDTLPQDRLMQLVAQRIVDKQILKLIKMWLKAPIVEEREDGKKGYKRNDKGTPQGGVISPLLANIYLNVLDTLWAVKKVQERLGARLVRWIKPSMIEAYQQKRLATVSRRGTPFKPASINRELEVMRRIFNLAMREEMMDRNPCWKVTRLSEKNARDRVLQREEFEKLLEHLPQHAADIVSVAYYTGMRAGEIFGLTWDRVNLKEDYFNLRPEETKTGEGRYVYFNGPVKGILERQRKGEEHCLQQCFYVSWKAHPEHQNRAHQRSKSR